MQFGGEPLDAIGHDSADAILALIDSTMLNTKNFFICRIEKERNKRIRKKNVAQKIILIDYFIFHKEFLFVFLTRLTQSHGRLKHINHLLITVT